MPSAIASHPTTSRSQLSSSRRSGAARSVGSMRTMDLGMSPGRERASSYVGPPNLKCATVSRVAPPSGGSHRMVAASHFHACISVARSTLAAWSTRWGGGGARMSEHKYPLHPTCGSGAACSHPSVAESQGWSGPAPQIMVGRGRVFGPDHSSGMAAYYCAGVPGARVAVHHRPHSPAHSTPTIRASNAFLEPRLMVHSGKRASRRCFDKPPGRSWYGWGSSCGGHSRVPFTMRRQATKPLPGRGGGGVCPRSR